jgi:hypothetical protein
MKNVISFLIIVIVLTTMTSCLVVKAEGDHGQPQSTLGQELIELQRAKDSGAITAQEYEELKEKLKKDYAQAES